MKGRIGVSRPNFGWPARGVFDLVSFPLRLEKSAVLLSVVRGFAPVTVVHNWRQPGPDREQLTTADCCELFLRLYLWLLFEVFCNGQRTTDKERRTSRKSCQIRKEDIPRHGATGGGLMIT